MAQKLPEEFQNQMKRLLGEAGFFAYLNALDEPYTRALRINLLLRPDGTRPAPSRGLVRLFRGQRAHISSRAMHAPGFPRSTKAVCFICRSRVR